MKKIFTTIINGYFGVLFPLIVIIILLEKLQHIISPLVQAIESKLNISKIIGVLGIILISIIIMLLLGYLCGMLIKNSWVKNLLKKLETGLLEKIPMYNLVKSIFATEVGIKGANDFRPALLVDGDAFSLCYVTNESDNFYTVYVSEGGLSGGELRIVPKNTVRLLDINLTEFTRLIKQYGIDSAKYAEQVLKATKES